MFEERYRLKRLESCDFIELPVVKRGTRSIDDERDQVTRITCRLNLAVIIYLGGSHRPSNLETRLERGHDERKEKERTGSLAEIRASQ